MRSGASARRFSTNQPIYRPLTIMSNLISRNTEHKPENQANINCQWYFSLIGGFIDLGIDRDILIGLSYRRCGNVRRMGSFANHRSLQILTKCILFFFRKKVDSKLRKASHSPIHLSDNVKLTGNNTKPRVKAAKKIGD